MMRRLVSGGIMFARLRGRCMFGCWWLRFKSLNPFRVLFDAISILLDVLRILRHAFLQASNIFSLLLDALPHRLQSVVFAFLTSHSQLSIVLVGFDFLPE